MGDMASSKALILFFRLGTLLVLYVSKGLFAVWLVTNDVTEVLKKRWEREDYEPKLANI